VARWVKAVRAGLPLRSADSRLSRSAFSESPVAVPASVCNWAVSNRLARERRSGILKESKASKPNSQQEFHSRSTISVPSTASCSSWRDGAASFDLGPMDIGVQELEG